VLPLRTLDACLQRNYEQNHSARLCESVSRFIWGNELMAEVLRERMKRELLRHREW
jgi:hypothetical protein